MTLSDYEIKKHLRNFSHKYATAQYEKRDTQSFYIDLFECFGVQQRNVSQFEQAIKNINTGKNQGYIDLLWSKVLLVEQKSAGRDLNKARKQADDYFYNLPDSDRPRYILVCDFQKFKLVDLESKKDEKSTWEFNLDELENNLDAFRFMQGQNSTPKKDIPLSIKASQKMAKLYDALRESAYDEKYMKYLLTQITYCFFADDTGIFQPQGTLYRYLKREVKKDLDIGPKLIKIFEVLNTPKNIRQKELDNALIEMEYINGKLFEQSIKQPVFTEKMTKLLMEAAEFNWTKISPAIFGSLFQNVMSKKERRDEGAHYTTEENILKVIKPLFLDLLHNEFQHIKSRKDTHREVDLKKLQDKLASLKFFDPACGAGNFLIIAYREIRMLELEIIKEIQRNKTLSDARVLSKVNVDQFYGIEINEFSARIAEIALWMMDHLMNQELSNMFGDVDMRFPITKHPNIKTMDALDQDWNEILASDECSYIFGNPPFRGIRELDKKQNDQLSKLIMSSNKKNKKGMLDYVTAWFIKAAKYASKNTLIGFVGTSSITQGQQVGALWNILKKYNISIFFAYPPFKWHSEARGAAQVVVVIIGMAKKYNGSKYLFIGNNVKKVPNITPYLTEQSKDIVISKVSQPLNGLPKLTKGTALTDFNHYVFSNDEKNAFLNSAQDIKPYILPWITAKGLLHNEKNWVLWLPKIPPNKIQKYDSIKNLTKLVKNARLTSKKQQTKELADDPLRFERSITPINPFLIIPVVTSANRKYIPMTIIDPTNNYDKEFINAIKIKNAVPSAATIICENTQNTNLINLFSLLQTDMHMLWVQHVSGRLKNDYRYSNIVYYTFPIPKNYVNDKILTKIGNDILKQHKLDNVALSDLYNDPMPTSLIVLYKKLNKYVESLYSKTEFSSDDERLNFLLKQYQIMINKGQKTLKIRKINNKVKRKTKINNQKKTKKSLTIKHKNIDSFDNG